MLIDFEEAKTRIETKRNAAADEYLRQQDCFFEVEAKLKKKRDFIIALFVIDCVIGLVAIMA